MSPARVRQLRPWLAAFIAVVVALGLQTAAVRRVRCTHARAAMQGLAPASGATARVNGDRVVTEAPEATVAPSDGTLVPLDHAAAGCPPALIALPPVATELPFLPPSPLGAFAPRAPPSIRKHFLPTFERPPRRA